MRMKSSDKAFSFVELISVIAVLGILASVGMVAVGNVTQNAHEEKLNSDTKTLNRAVMAYRASGGVLESTDTAETVLTKLRTRATAAAAKRLPGFSGSFLDSRLALKKQSSEEAASNAARVYWDGTSQSFFVAKSGSQPGVKEFYLDDALAEIDGGTEQRESPLVYSEKDGWIWDYAEVALPSGPSGPTPVAIVPDTPSGTPSTPVAPVTPPPAPITPGAALFPPVFSMPGGGYGINLYDLTVSLSNPNPPGSSDIFYSLNYGAWQAYSGPFATHPDDVISAQAVATTSNYSDSAKTDQIYTATPVTLSPPIINASSDVFRLFSNKPINIDLVDTNEPGVGKIRYRLDGGPWLPYTSGFWLQRKNYPAGVEIEAQVVSVGSQYYSPSSVSARTLNTESLNLVGDTEGSFHDPTGPSGMVSNLAPGQSSSHFEWGEDSHPSDPQFEAGLSRSTMDFTGNSFGNIAGGERFQIGKLDYYNGTILGGSGADSVEFTLGLNLNINGNMFNPYFDFSFGLVNVLNQGDPNNPWVDADYVLLDDPVSSRTLIINDYEFEFRIEMGDATSDGFAAFNEFHVLEEKTASANVYGTFIEIGPIVSMPPSTTTTSFATTDPLAGTSSPVYQNDGYVDVEQAVKDLLDQAKYENGVAKNTKGDADDANHLAQKAADQAIAKGKEALDKNKAADARKKADESIQFADEATAQAAQAKKAAIDSAAAASAAQAAADEAGLLAQSNPGAEKDAKDALAEAAQAAEEATTAREYATSAHAAAATAKDYAAKADAWADSLAD